jgi:transcriptional regulator GlxA family with amidase domain
MPASLHIVEVLAYPSVQLLDVTGPLQVFASANDLGARPQYQFRVVSPSGGMVTASAGIGLATAPMPRRGAAVDTLVVPGGPGLEVALRDRGVLAFIRRRSREARRTASVCTGAFLLAAAGLLDGRRAATHWSFCAELARRFPAVRVEADPIFLRDGPIWTSAGVTAGIDLALALVEADLGRRLALALARYLVVFFKRPGGQAQFSAALSLQTADRTFDPLHAWIRAHLADDLSLAVLARQARMSPRSFSRHYAAEVGVTPIRAVEKLRVESARHLLAETRLGVKQIATRCGFGSEETLRRSFVRILTVTPRDYRAHFGSPVSSMVSP